MGSSRDPKPEKKKKKKKIKSMMREATESHEDVAEVEQEIKKLHVEKEEHLQAVHARNVSSKLAGTRHKKVQELEKEKQVRKFKLLCSEIQSLKETRIKLIRQMRNDENNFTKWKQSREEKINRLRTQDRKRTNEMVQLKMQHNEQQNVLKRKIEEAFAVNKRLKGALEMQKKVVRRQEKELNKDGVKTWMAEDSEILMATIKAAYSFGNLLHNRASLMHKMG